MRIHPSGLALIALALAMPAAAAQLEVRVASTGGHPLQDAAMVLEPADGAVVAAAAPATRTIDQVDETFVPLLEVFRSGDSVVFRNSDDTRHHAYSFAPVRPFELELQPGDSSAPLTLPRSGLVTVGCNIHDRMITYLFVSDAPFVARSGADGRARFEGVPPGRWTLRTWHPWLRDRDAPAVQPLTLADAPASVAVVLDVRPERRPDDPERVDY